LEIAGDGACAEELRRLVKELGISDVVRLLGEVQDVPGLLARGSVFALSSLTEGISLTIMEAMASGLPVVATRVGGNPEVVKDGETGLLVPVGDADALAAALLKLWRDSALRHEMGAAGRARIEEHFDVRKMVAAYEEIYRGNSPG
jgi:glycosyltransferase involved in cell wall biosynthesis